MNFLTLLARRLRTAAPPLLAVLLTIVLAGAALAQEPPSPPGGPPGNPLNNDPSANPPVNPSTPPENPPTGGGPPGTPPSQPPSTPNNGTMPDPMLPTMATGHPSAPFTPPADCIVAHAATPAQLCPIDGDLQYCFIGADGASQQGPWIQPFSQLATLGAWSIYTGTNPKTGKSVQINYLAAENKIRVSTFYPDTQYDTNKPYNFTVDTDHNISHEAW